MRNTKRAVGRGMGFMNRLTSHSAFTMAEILLSLTIIGVVAAITLPSLTGNINERTWATQKKALYARMSQAFPLMDSINTYDDAESFVAAALNSVTKINNVCGQANVTECGMDGSSIGTLNGSTIANFDKDWYKWSNLGVTALTGTSDDIAKFKDSNGNDVTDEKKLVAAFETGNGESIVIFYNPTCISDQELSPEEGGNESWINYVCANLVYDLNNQKGPNTVGKDIGFMTVFYPTDSVVVNPVPDTSTVKGSKASGTVEGGNRVASKLPKCSTDEYRLPNKYEAMSMALNNIFLGKTTKTGGGTNTSALEASKPVITTSSKSASTSGTYYVSVQGKKVYTNVEPVDEGETHCVKR